MSVGLMGRKLGMTQIFREDGRWVPVTVLSAGPCTVTFVRSAERDGYRAVQLGFEEVKADRLSKPVAGHFLKRQLPAHRILKEFRLPTDQTFEVGSSLNVELFKVGDRVDVTARSIGKGFQGGVKRWHWKGGPETHGSMSHRRPGSIGSSTNPSRVFKGHHLPGHMGNRQVTTIGLEVVKVDPAQNLLLVKGSVPGVSKAVVLIRKSRKPPKLAVVHKPQAKKKMAQPAKPQAAGKEKDKKKAGSPQ